MGFDIHQWLVALILAMDVLFLQYLLKAYLKGTEWVFYFEW